MAGYSVKPAVLHLRIVMWETKASARIMCAIVMVVMADPSPNDKEEDEHSWTRSQERMRKDASQSV